MLRRMGKIADFLSEFLKGETSQVTKIDILKISSVLAVFVIAALPQPTVANCESCVCDCTGACNWEYCNYQYTCPNGCRVYSTSCSGGGTAWATYCDGSGWQCYYKACA